MSRRLDITVSDALFDAIMQTGQDMGFANDPKAGKRAVVTQALHAYVNRRGAPAEVLRMDDEAYRLYLQAESGKDVPDVRNGRSVDAGR